MDNSNYKLNIIPSLGNFQLMIITTSAGVIPKEFPLLEAYFLKIRAQKFQTIVNCPPFPQSQRTPVFVSFHF